MKTFQLRVLLCVAIWSFGSLLRADEDTNSAPVSFARDLGNGRTCLISYRFRGEQLEFAVIRRAQKEAIISKRSDGNGGILLRIGDGYSIPISGSSGVLIEIFDDHTTIAVMRVERRIFEAFLDDPKSDGSLEELIKVIKGGK